MRRKDREVKGIKELIKIIDECSVCRIAMIDGDIPYIVPMNFGYSINEEQHIKLYFHSAGSGRKMKALSLNPRVCFEMDCEHECLPSVSGKACDWSFAYASIIGEGKIRALCEDEKIFGLTKIMDKITGLKDFSFNENSVKNTVVFELAVTSMTGKRHTRQ